MFSRVKPKSNFLEDGGMGAVELGLRYSTMDLSDSGINGGELEDWTAGVNWYLNPNTLVRLNYAIVDIENAHGAGAIGDGTVNVFGMRFQVDF